MVVCHCRAVSDCHVRQAIRAGAADIETIARQCGAGSRCGGCRPALAMLLADLGRGPQTADDGLTVEPNMATATV